MWVCTWRCLIVISGKYFVHALHPALVDYRSVCNPKVVIAEEAWSQLNGEVDSEQMREVTGKTGRMEHSVTFFLELLDCRWGGGEWSLLLTKPYTV